jgi:hypothetical protein
LQKPQSVLGYLGLLPITVLRAFENGASGHLTSGQTGQDSVGQLVQKASGKTVKNQWGIQWVKRRATHSKTTGQRPRKSVGNRPKKTIWQFTC